MLRSSAWWKGRGPRGLLSAREMPRAERPPPCFAWFPLPRVGGGGKEKRARGAPEEEAVIESTQIGAINSWPHNQPAEVPGAMSLSAVLLPERAPPLTSSLGASMSLQTRTGSLR